MERPWWDDVHYREILSNRVASTDWYVVFNDGTPGKVVLVCWGGYKIQLPDGATRLTNPNDVSDILHDNYAELADVWNAKQSQLALAKAEQESKVEADKIALELIQTNCLHEITTEIEVQKHPACDVMDTTCNTCGKLLRKSWATNNDRDPNDHISDWNWWCREYQKRYGSLPNHADYDVVTVITGQRW
jgi:hypothetical protein